MTHPACILSRRDMVAGPGSFHLAATPEAAKDPVGVYALVDRVVFESWDADARVRVALAPTAAGRPWRVLDSDGTIAGRVTVPARRGVRSQPAGRVPAL